MQLTFILDDEIEGEEALGEDDVVIHAEEGDVIDDSPSDCCPDPFYKKFPVFAGDDDSPFWQGWGNLRLKTFQLIENKYFETAVITMILLSSLALVRQQLNQKSQRRKILKKKIFFLHNRLLKTFTYPIDQFFRTSSIIWTEYSR